MEVLTIDGKRYIKSAKAASDLGYAKDYVSQLCRKGLVDAKLVGRTWYVDQDELSTHRVEKKRNARVKAREHAKRALLKVVQENQSPRSSRKTSDSLVIRYESDNLPLVPEVRKVPVTSKLPPKDDIDFLDTAPRYVIENEHKRIVMEGTLSIVDAELEESDQDDHATMLIPRIIKPRQRKLLTQELKTETDTTVVDKDGSSTSVKPALDTTDSKSQDINLHNNAFIEKMQSAGVNLGDSTEELDVVSTEHDKTTGGEVRSFNVAMYAITMVTTLLLCLVSLFFESVSLYSHESNSTFQTYGFSYEKVFDMLRMQYFVP